MTLAGDHLMKAFYTYVVAEPCSETVEDGPAFLSGAKGFMLRLDGGKECGLLRGMITQTARPRRWCAALLAVEARW